MNQFSERTLAKTAQETGLSLGTVEVIGAALLAAHNAETDGGYNAIEGGQDTLEGYPVVDTSGFVEVPAPSPSLADIVAAVKAALAEDNPDIPELNVVDTGPVSTDWGGGT